MLGKSVPGCLPNKDLVGQGPTVLAVGREGACLDPFSLIYQILLTSFSLSLGDSSR